ncbi:MAG: WD40 repeat [Glomeribacter sp. 1016415]|nr:WD40 repeat [Glomeribacter sp. 1016415]
MSPINPSQSTQPSLAPYLPQLASAYSSTEARATSNTVYEEAKAVMQINYGLINIPVVGSHNEVTVHYHSTASDAELLREILRSSQSTALQTNTAPLASLGVEQLRKRYLDGLQKDQEIKDALTMYVTLECTLITNTGERFSLEEKVKDFLASEEKKVLLLLGDAGSGKSTFNRYLARSLWKAYEEATDKSNDTPIPLFIPLSSLKEPNENLISEYLKKEKFTEEQIADLQANNRFIFILDGYDEIKDRARLFYVENDLDQWTAKVIVSSRPEYLGERYDHHFRPKGQAHLLQTYQLVPFSDLTIEEYVSKYKNTYPELAASIVEGGEILERPEVKELVRNPFLLKMALSELPILAEKYKGSSQRITRLALYDQFVESWFKRSQDRLSSIRLTDEEQKAFHFLNKSFTKHGTQFSKDFAIAMYQANLVSVEYSEPLSYGHDVVRQDWRHKFLSGNNEKIKLLRFNAPLICRYNQYQFIHKSIRDYLVARTLSEELGAHNELESSAWFNTLNIVSDPAILQFLSERMQQEPALKAQLLSVVEQSKAEEGAQFERGAANALTILVKAGVQLMNKDFSGIHVRGADLSYGVFENTQFEGADLKDVMLRGARLCDVNMRQANLGGVNFGEMPALELNGQVHACHYSPDGQWLAVGTNFGGSSLYRLKKAGAQQKLKLEHVLGWSFLGVRFSGSSQVFSHDSQWLALADYAGTVGLWSVETGKLERAFAHSNRFAVKSVAFSKNSQWLASGCQDKTIKLWEVKTGNLQYTLEGHENWVCSVSISPDGKWLASGSLDKTLRLWELRNAEAILRQTLTDHNDVVNSVSFSPNGKWLASGGNDRTLKLWELESAGVLLRQTLEGHDGAVESVSFSSDKKWLASGSQDNVVKLWELKNSGAVLHQTFEGHGHPVTTVSFSPANDWLASGSMDKTVKLWALRNEEVLSRRIFDGHSASVWSVAVSQDGKWLASGSADKTVKLWELGSAGVILRQTLEGHNGWVVSLSISPDGKWLASGSVDKTVKLWSLENAGRAMLHQTLESHTGKVWGVSISSDNKWLVSSGGDGTIKLWELNDKEAFLHQTLEGHNDQVRNALISPDGKWLVSGSADNTVKLWRLNAHRASLQHTLEGHNHQVIDLSFSPDSKWLASGSFDCTVKLWELNDEGASLRQTFKGHKREVFSVAFSPDGNWLASGGMGGVVKLWSLDTGKCEATVQSFVKVVFSVIWQEFAENSAKFVMAGSENIIRIFQLERKGSGWNSNLYWASYQNELAVSNLIIDGARDLSAENKLLIKQKQSNLGASGSSNSERRYVRQLEAVINGVKLFENWWNSSGMLIQPVQSSDPVRVNKLPGAFPEETSNELSFNSFDLIEH